MTELIKTENLGRHFGEIRAVDGISFSASRGEVLGFLGPNGAGKSTTMKLLTGFLTPSFGTATVGGYDIISQSRQVRSCLGYLPENAPLYGDMEVADFLKFVCEIRKIAPSDRKRAIDTATQRAGLAEVLSQRIETLSKGYRRRVGLAQALVHDPEILILDEPTDGLDPNQKHDVRELISTLAKDKCILLSTHILEEVEEVCSRIVIISRGKIVADGTADELRTRTESHGVVKMRLAGAEAQRLTQSVAAVSGVRDVAVSTANDEVLLQVTPHNGDFSIHGLVERVLAEHCEIRDLSVERGHLDEVFRAITETVDTSGRP
ncbi:MAG: ABC transporter ATP-binding protein [Bdellovibrionales bacterium]|nr:ABC transporter ATP-binding protein [Bdellovibrionales bacterium]